MILFVNFAPITFLGGAERWVLSHTRRIVEKEKVNLVCASPGLASHYGKLVLGRAFNERMSPSEKSSLPPLQSLTFRHFIPFTREYRSVRDTFTQARIVYLKFEILEIFITLYFGGISTLKKVIGGLHTPFVYKRPQDFFGKLHNVVYMSPISRFVLSRLKKIHVLNNRDKTALTKGLHLKNVVEIPNSLPLLDAQSPKKKSKELSIIFVGELTQRKGIDVLTDIIHRAPKTYAFNIVGDGPLQTGMKRLAARNTNVTYHGHLEPEKVAVLYEKNDVLLLPSRAEGLPLVILEALRSGLKVVDSEDISLHLPEGIEHSCSNENVYTYLQALSKIEKENQKTGNRTAIQTYFKKNYSDNAVLPKLYKDVFGIPYV